MKWSKTFWFQIEFMDGKNDIARKKALTLDQVHLFYVGNICTDFQPNYFFASSLDFYLEPKGAKVTGQIFSN